MEREKKTFPSLTSNSFFKGNKNLEPVLSKAKLILSGLWSGCHGLFNVGTCFEALNDLSRMSLSNFELKRYNEKARLSQSLLR